MPQSEWINGIKTEKENDGRTELGKAQRKTLKEIVTSPDKMGYTYLAEADDARIENFAKGTFGKIKLSRDGSEILSEKFTDYINRMAVKSQLNGATLKEYSEKHSELSGDSLQLGMEYLNDLKSDISTADNRDCYTDGAFEMMKEISEIVPIGCKRFENEKLTVLNFSDYGNADAAKGGADNATIGNLKQCAANSLGKFAMTFDNESVYYNFLSSSDVKFDSRSLTDLYLGKSAGGKVKPQTRKARAEANQQLG